MADWFADNSGMTARMQLHFVNVQNVADGVPTPLGAVETWSPSLKSFFGILLNSGCPMFLVWDYAPLPCTPNERILLYNKAYCSLLDETQHFSLSDRVNIHWTERWNLIRTDVEQVLSTGQVLQCQQKLIPTELNGKSNKLLYACSYNPVWDEIGQVRGVLATGFQAVTEGMPAPDLIAERRQDRQESQSFHQPVQAQIDTVSLQDIEAALRESKARFTAFMDHSPTAAWIADSDGRLLYLNPTYFQMFQFPQQDAVGKQIQEIYSDEFAQQFLENNRRVFQTGQIIETVETAPRSDGSMGSFLVYKFPIAQESGGQLLGGVAVDITKYKRTEERLRHREEELRLITNALPVLIAYVDKDHYYRFNNETYETWFGQPAASFTGQSVQSVLGNTAYEAVLPYIEQVLAGQRVSFESQISHREGGIRYVRSDYVPHINHQGEVEGYFSLVSDISDSKQAEAERDRLLGELSSERAQFEAVLCQMPEGVMIADAASGNLILANEQANEILRYNYTLDHDLEAYEQQVPFQAYRTNGQLYTSDEYPLVRSLRSGEVITHEEIKICYPDGSDIVIDVNSSPIFDIQGHVTSAVVVFQDITERQQIEQALRSSEMLYRTLSEAVPDFIWSCNEQGQADFVNSRWMEYTGLTIEQLNAGGLAQVNHPDDFPKLMAQWESATQKGETLEAEFRYRRWDGEYRWFMGRAVPIKNDHGSIIRWIGTTTDIHDRKQAEETLRQSEERLRIAQRSANVGVWDWDITTNQVAWSDEYYRLYGLDPTIQPSYENWLHSIIESERDRIDQAIRDALKQQIDLNVEFRVLHPALGERWLTAIGQTFYDDNGRPMRMTGIALDITHRKQAEKALERYQLLSEHSRDIVLYFRSNGQVLEANRAAVQAYGYNRTELLTLNISDLRMPETLSHMPKQFEQALKQGILFETIHRRKDGSAFPVEVSAQSTVIGDEKIVLSIIRDITERKKAEVEREQLLVQEQTTREVAEAAEQRAKFLADASKTLASSLDYEYTLKSVAQAVVPNLADWCAVDILKDDGTLERLATAHVDPAKVQWGLELHRRYPPDLSAPHGIAQVLRTGQSEYYPTISDDQIVAAARDDEHLRILRELGFSSVMLVPLNARGRTLGSISFVATESERSYSLEDLSLAEELARRAAIALDNARLYQQAQQAQESAERAADRMSRLQMVTAALSESLTPEQVAEVIVEQSMATLEATAALVVLVSHNRTELEIVKSVGYQVDLVDAWRRFSINTDVPLAEAIRTGEPVWVETILDRIARYPHLAETYKRYEFNAWIALPLVVEGKSIGGLLLSFTEFRLLNQEDRDFTLALTRQCAQAIVRAQLYEAERQSRAEAEQANRIKDEFLAVLSHELRSPLNPILGWSKLLQNRTLDAVKTQQALKTIERNAKLQAELIEDLLDVSRILQGKLNLNINLINLIPLIRAAMETVRLAAAAKSIKVEENVGPDAVLVSGDATRLQQVIWNLLSNAVKFTPIGGQVYIRLERVDSYAHITVSDTGAGIEPGFLPYVFDYFRQADGATTRKFGGLGLGLAIVRHLVELHGGTVEAASPGIGMGATFTVRLPLMSQLVIAHRTEQSSSASSDLQGIQVLVVDDELDSREFVAFVLEQAGATVLTATTAAEVLTLLLQSKPNVLLSDIGMPEMDGYMLMQQVRALPVEQGGQVPAIALTAYAGETNQQQVLAAGFQQHLTKPIEPETLVKAIAALVQLS